MLCLVQDLNSCRRIHYLYLLWRCLNGYRRRKLTRRLEFKSWTRLIAFHIELISLGKVWIQLFSLQLWVNSRADWVLQPWWGNCVAYPWYMDMWNRHRESKNTKLYEIGSSTKLLFTFLSLKVFRHKERQTQYFYADCFYIFSSQPNQFAVAVAHKVVWPHPALKVNFLLPRQELNYLLFLKYQPTLPVHDVTQIPWFQFLSVIFILTSLNGTSSPRAREHLR